jgi:leader peptidase (prepilin peptidase)/N-methyltransferase
MGRDLLSISFLAIATWTDLRTRRIPNALSLAAGLTLAPAILIIDGPVSLAYAVGWGTLSALPLLVVHLRSPSGMGGGDVKAALVAGAAVGAASPLFLGISSLVAAGFGTGLAVMQRRRSIRSQALPFAPFMLAGMIATLWSE